MSQIESIKLIQIRKGESICIRNREPNQNIDANDSGSLRANGAHSNVFVGRSSKDVYVYVAYNETIFGQDFM